MSTAILEPPTEKSELTTFEIVPADIQLPEHEKLTIEQSFGQFFQQAANMRDQAAKITSPKLARVARLEIKALRVAAEKKRQALKADILVMGKAIDGANNLLLGILSPVEKRLDDIEKEEERREAARIAALHEERWTLISPYLTESFGQANFGGMAQKDFDTLLADHKALHDARIERERKAEEERLAREVAEAKERERLRLDNERLLQEAKEREEAARIEREKQEAILKAEREKAAAAQREADAKLAAERAAAEAKQREIEEVARQERLKEQAAREVERQRVESERYAVELKLAEERAAREKIEREQEAARQAEILKAQKEAEAAAASALAPDKEKLKAIAKSLCAIPNPEMKTKKGQAALQIINTKLAEFVAWIETKAEKL